MGDSIHFFGGGGELQIGKHRVNLRCVKFSLPTSGVELRKQKRIETSVSALQLKRSAKLVSAGKYRYFKRWFEIFSFVEGCLNALRFS